MRLLAAGEIEGFPRGNDPYLGRRWISNGIRVGCKATVHWLLAQGVELDFTDDEGYSPVHSAIERELSDGYEVLELLLRAGALVNRKGFTTGLPRRGA